MVKKIIRALILIGAIFLVASCELFQKEIRFGDWDGQADQLSKERSTFSAMDPISSVTDFEKAVGTTTLVFTLSKIDKTTVSTWDQTIDPKVTHYLYGFWDPNNGDNQLEPGTYRLTIYSKKNDQNLASGTFTIK